ncbi:hypothetical protein [Sphingomicrobium lutaoense]|uniref:Uncharacterized protein n=1 Tax=Sphingomicrobium lutaoense TaxID=515949 RepID=A0A839Z1G7_9SPHN|nr:hypothetical protein [Sphingomicrobium lutaoense]MBB3763897.1 hypothetical protein [Sphingomicrobium lutaoense]
MSQELLHNYLDRADRALSRIEAALARKRDTQAEPPSPAPADDSALRREVARVIEELDSLMEGQSS